MTNGEKPSSKVLSHLQSYPLVHDSLELYRTNPYGAKSLSLINTTYTRFIHPLNPYLQTPYSYLSPYLHRADDLADTGLSNLDSQFPIVKEDTSKLKEKVLQGFDRWAPFRFAKRGQEYVWRTWEDEYGKVGGEEGVVRSVKAIVSTELKVGLDGVNVVREWVRREKEVVAKKGEEVRQ